MSAWIDDVFVNHEALIFRRGRIHPASFALPMFAAHFERPSRYLWFLIKNYWLRRTAVVIPQALWVIDNLSAGNYFHWMTECLPRLLVAEAEYPDARVLVLPRHYREDPYVEFTLKAFPGVSSIGWVGQRGKVRVARLALVTRPAPSNTFVPGLMREISERVGALAGAPAAAQRLYFSRAGARHRRAVNERDVIQVFRAHEFEIVEVDPTNPVEQVEMSLAAQVIAGVHGAALTNMIFMQPGSQVLEFRHPKDELFPDCYRPLAEAMGHEYKAQICQPLNSAPAWEKINRSDLAIDLDLLRETLNSIT